MGLMMALNAAVSGLRTTQESINLVVAERRERQFGGLYPPHHVAGPADRGRAHRRRAQPARSSACSMSWRRSSSGWRPPAPPTPPLHGELCGRARPAVRPARRRRRARHHPQHLHAVAADARSTIRAARSARPPCSTTPASSRAQIGRISESVQALRSDAEGRIGRRGRPGQRASHGHRRAQRADRGAPGRLPIPALLDERDRMINELSQLMDVQTFQNGRTAR